MFNKQTKISNQLKFPMNNDKNKNKKKLSLSGFMSTCKKILQHTTATVSTNESI